MTQLPADIKGTFTQMKMDPSLGFTALPLSFIAIMLRVGSVNFLLT